MVPPPASNISPPGHVHNTAGSNELNGIAYTSIRAKDQDANPLDTANLSDAAAGPATAPAEGYSKDTTDMTHFAIEDDARDEPPLTAERKRRLWFAAGCIIGELSAQHNKMHGRLVCSNPHYAAQWPLNSHTAAHLVYYCTASSLLCGCVPDLQVMSSVSAWRTTVSKPTWGYT